MSHGPGKVAVRCMSQEEQILRSDGSPSNVGHSLVGMYANIAATYRHFAEAEARGISATYDQWARGVSQDPAVLALLSELPGLKIQPNLVFAAARLKGAPVGDYEQFRAWLLTHWGEVKPEVLQRATQTNEANRCAVMLPILSRLDRLGTAAAPTAADAGSADASTAADAGGQSVGERAPLALIEAGASAGLCLYPDRYSYAYTTTAGETVKLHPKEGPSEVILPAAIDADWVPDHIPEVAYRAGADLNPLNLADADELAWLETLIWPEHQERRDRLHAAARIALQEPARIVAGDLVEAVPDLVRQAPAEARIVVFHTWVLYYLSPEHREAFRTALAEFPNITWISSEPYGVLPWVDQRHKTPFDHRVTLAVNGKPAALVGTHGQSFEALRRVDPFL